MSARRWTAVAERGSLWGLRLTAAIYRYGGSRLAAALVTLVVTYFFLTDRRGRAASLQYLRRLYQHRDGAKALGRAPSTRDVYRHYLQFGLATLDRLRFAVAPDDLDLIVHGEAELARLVARGEGAVIVGAHLGNFDALRAFARRGRVPVNVVLTTRNAAQLAAVLRAHAAEPALRVFDLSMSGIDAIFTLRACIARGEFVAILADRVPPGVRARPLRAPFLGADAPFPRGPFLLAATLQCPVILMVALRRGGGRYEVFAEPLTPDVSAPGHRAWAKAAAIDYAQRLERLCLVAPYQWFNFFDFWADEPKAIAA